MNDRKRRRDNIIACDDDDQYFLNMMYRHYIIFFYFLVYCHLTQSSIIIHNLVHGYMHAVLFMTRLDTYIYVDFSTIIVLHKHTQYNQNRQIPPPRN